MEEELKFLHIKTMELQNALAKAYFEEKGKNKEWVNEAKRLLKHYDVYFKD